MATTYSYTSYENINNVSSYIYSSYITEDLSTTYYSYTYAQIVNIDKDMTYNSYVSYNIDIATINFNAGYLDNINKKLLDKNLLVVSMFDNKMFYNKNIDMPDYQKNGILFINNENNIIPLSQNIKNIDSALTLENDQIQIKIDSNTIKDIDNKLVVDNSKLRLANNDIPGLFKVDNESLIIEDNAITISYNIQDIINNIDDHISIMTNIIDQTNNNLDEVMKTFKANVLYDKKYSCNTNEKYPIYYSNDIRNDILMDQIDKEVIENNIVKNITLHEYYIKYWQKFFKLKVKFVYNYLSSTLLNFNPFNEKYLNITINCNNENVKKCIKLNINKSYIYDNNVTYFNEHTNNVYGEVNYICYFDIDNDSLYNIENLVNNYEINIEIEYNDTLIKMSSTTNVHLILFIDVNKNDILNKILYHNYDVGFNYDGIGNRVGVCMIRKGNSNTDPLNSNKNYYKPIFLKYFENESNIIENNISLNIFENIINDQNNINDPEKKLTIYDSSNRQNYNIVHIDVDDQKSPHMYNNANNKYFFYKGQNLDSINYNINSIVGVNNIFQKLMNTKEQYKKYLKYCFNNTYNIHGNGLRHGDCYVPSVEELAIFYILGFNNYNNYKDITADCDVIYTQFFYPDSYLYYTNILTSSTLYKQYDKIYLLNYLYRYNYTINEISIFQYQMKIPTTLIDENNQYKITNELTGYDSITNFLKHKSISLFKLPDFSILNGNEYNLSYDEENGYEVIDYLSKSHIKLKVKCNNDNIGSVSETFKIYCSDSSVEFSKISYNEIENNIYEISFTIKKYNHFYNNIDIYYIDIDPSLNTNILNIENTDIECRILCRVSIKID